MLNEMRANGAVLLADLMTNEDRAQLGVNSMLTVSNINFLSSDERATLMVSLGLIGLAGPSRETYSRTRSILCRRRIEFFQRWSDERAGEFG